MKNKLSHILECLRVKAAAEKRKERVSQYKVDCRVRFIKRMPHKNMDCLRHSTTLTLLLMGFLPLVLGGLILSTLFLLVKTIEKINIFVW